MALDPRREAFAHRYIIRNGNGTQAARDIGLPEGSAHMSAFRMLAEPEVQERISELRAELARELHIDAGFVLRELLDIARTDPNEIVQHRRTCCRYCWSLTGDYLRTPREMQRDREAHMADEAKRAAEGKDPTPFDERGGDGYDARREPDPDCRECFGEGVASVFAQDTRLLSPGARALYAGVKTTKDGIEVKLHSKEKALELLGRHLELFKDKLEVDLKTDLAQAIQEARKRVGGA